MSDFFVKFLDFIYEILSTVFVGLFYLVIMAFAIPIYVIILVVLCIVWSFMLIKYLII